MKPVVIIVVSVICSVVAVLGVLVAMDMYAVSESQKAIAIELERQKVCDKLYDNTGSLQDIELWGICLNYGIIESVNSDVELCGNSLSDYAELCRSEKKLEAIRLIEREIRKPLADELLFGKLSAGGTVKVGVSKDRIVLTLS